MKIYTTVDLHEHTADIQRAAAFEPVVIASQGRPRMVISSVEEFTRLKHASGEQIPKEIVDARTAVVRRGLPDDPLGYDTSDLRYCALAMTEAALSGRNREIAAVETRLMQDE